MCARSGRASRLQTGDRMFAMPMRASSLYPLAFAVVAAGAIGATACGTDRPPRIEDDARAMAPVPACIVPLPGRARGKGQTMRNLGEEQYWGLIFPDYDAQNKRLPVDAVTCTGVRVFDDPVFAGGTTRGSPIEVQDGDIVYGNGGDRVRIVWLRTHKWPDGSEAGALALVRAKEDFAEVYAIGAYRRSNGQLTLQAERLGTEVLASATDDGCQGQAKTTPCETDIALFIPRFGKLKRLTTIATEKRVRDGRGARRPRPSPVPAHGVAQVHGRRNPALRAGQGDGRGGACGPQNGARAVPPFARRNTRPGIGLALGSRLPRGDHRRAAGPRVVQRRARAVGQADQDPRPLTTPAATSPPPGEGASRGERAVAYRPAWAVCAAASG